MKRILTTGLILTVVIVMAACSTDERKTTETIGEKEAKAAVLAQVQAEEEREVELISLTDIDGTWYSLVSLTDGDNVLVEDGCLEMKETGYTYHEFNKMMFYYGKKKGFFDSGWSREIAGKTIYVSISRWVIVNERPHWHSGGHRVNDDVEIHYSLEWD